MPPKPMSDVDIANAETRLVNYYRSLAANPKKDSEKQMACRSEDRPRNTGVRGDPWGWRVREYLVYNTSTDTRYAVKIQSETVDQRASRNKRGAPPRTPPEDFDRLAHTPPITPSSEATIRSPTEVAARSLIAKNYRENRTYLQYVKSGHPNICALEAFLDFTSQVGAPTDRGLVMFASYYEYCDGGDLGTVMEFYARSYSRWERTLKKNREIVKSNVGRSHRGKKLLAMKEVPVRAHPPELFIWHVFQDLAEHQDRAFVTTADLAPANVFLKWPVGKPRTRCYPDVKVGDFGDPLQESTLRHEFPENRISELVAGEWEREDNLDQEDAQKEEETQDREAALMWVEKDRKLKFGIKLEEWEEGYDEDHAKWLKELIKNKPNLYQELLKEARINVPSP
ncbi:hypothetical protein EYC84_000154 [Monilinia fructicola]|uniref:Uncharacterized protein n=1 Tax=Monilinia fructicola TaxID=38448 RepID=A0A5M9JRT0_MONFR|nr:hypothetical protein EYC84_000154 [Monilinia fructicola]